MSGYSEIKRKLLELTGGKVLLPISCEVVSIQGISCTVRVVGGLEIPDVRLRASLSDIDSSLVLTPKVGSKALIWSVTGELDDLVLLKADSFDKISYKAGGLEINIDASTGKVTVKKDDVSLKSLFQEVHDIITNLKVATPSGPSTGLLPDTTASLITFQTHFNHLLNG